MKQTIILIILNIVFIEIGEGHISIPSNVEYIIPKEKEKQIFEIDEELYAYIPYNVAIRDLHILHPYFRNKVIELLYECRKQGIYLEISETYRNKDRQNYVKKRGLSFLTGGRSKHQYGIAVDVVPIDPYTKEFLWHDKELWYRVGKIGESLGLLWGGRWSRIKDYPHFELPISIKDIDTLIIPDTILVPLNYSILN